MKKSFCFILLLPALLAVYAQSTGSGVHELAVVMPAAVSYAQRGGSSKSKAIALYDKGVKLIKAKDYSSGKDCIIRSANMGYHKAMVTAGICYMNESYGFEHNLQQEVYLFSMAAKEGDAEGQYCLGFCYAIGEGVKKNSRKAMWYLSKAAKQGEPNAQLMLGAYYSQYRQIMNNQKKAFNYFMYSAERGNPIAQYFVGRYYVEGIHGYQNRSTGIEWLMRAKEQGSLPAVKYLKRLGL